MKSIVIAALTIVPCIATATPSYSNKPQQAASCESCHGAGGGMPTNSSIPKLNGQNRTYLVTTLKEYKSGKRQNPVMQSVLANISESDIESLAEYFSQQKCK